MSVSDRRVRRLFALTAFLDGFERGADHQGFRKRHTSNPDTDKHWFAGHAVGKAAREAATAEYKKKIEEEIV